MSRVAIMRGSIAGLAAAYLLASRGMQVTLPRTPAATPLPAIELQPGAIALILDLFGDVRQAGEVLALSRTIVSWGKRGREVRPSPALVISPRDLGQWLRCATLGRFPDLVVQAEPCEQGDWRLEDGRTTCSDNAPLYATVAVFGRSGPPDLSFTHGLGFGWLHLTPLPRDRYLVQLLTFEGPPEDPEEALDSAVQQAGLAELVEAPQSAPVTLAAAAALADGLAEQGCLRIGGGAWRLDPIAGDGLGHGLRSSILAAAAISAQADGKDRSALNRHYEGRIRAAFGFHLQACRELYHELPRSPGRDAYLAHLSEGLAFLGRHAEPERMRLAGSELLEIAVR